MLVFRNSLLAKWLREWVRVRVRAGARERSTFYFPCLAKCGEHLCLCFFVCRLLIFNGDVAVSNGLTPHVTRLREYSVTAEVKLTSTLVGCGSASGVICAGSV